MTDPIKVLAINFDSSEYNGVPVFLMNVFRNIDHNKIHLDFLTADISAYNPWREEIEQEGGNIYELHIDTTSTRGKLSFGKQLRLFLTDHPYDIVHINSGAVSLNCISTNAAKSRGVKVIIHSHNSGGRSRWKAPVVFFMKRRMQRKADILCACSVEAARNVFTGRKVDSGEVIIINNGIDLEKFRYDVETRNRVRKELGIEDQFVVGHVGRFAEQKNHEFLIDIFTEINCRQSDAILILVGQGELEESIREKVHALNLDSNVFFLGQRDDVEDIYKVMDVFLFPSLYEGLPISLVEAQVSGLPCCISDTITKEIDLTPLIHRISLKLPASEWAETVLLIKTGSNLRESFDRELRKEGFGIDMTATRISQLYESMVQG